MIVWILNIASICFFFATIIGLHRKWKSREHMESTSLEGTLFHVIGNSLIAIYGLMVGAYIAVVMESFLTCLGVLTLYWKLKWLISGYNWNFLCALGLHKWYYYPFSDRKKRPKNSLRQCTRCLKIQEKITSHETTGYPLYASYWKDVLCQS